LQKDTRTVVGASGVTMETTAMAGSTFVGPSGVAVRRTGSPVARHGEVTWAVWPRTAPAQLYRTGRGRLGDDGGVRPYERAGYRRLHRQRDRLRESADHRPHERALPLAVVPRVVVVGYPQRLEAGLFGHARLLDEFRRAMLLTREEVSEGCHRAS
jgi:hypothetical protein